MKKLLSKMLIVFMTALVILSVTSSVASAHERRAVSRYLLVVGWIVEPALEGQKNGVDFRVTDNSSGTTVPVLGLEKTVKVEITYIPTGFSKVFDLRTIFNDPGHYTADLILTDAGVYRMRFFGDLEATPLNETFNSRGGGGGYNDVLSTVDMKFPTKVAEVREIEAVARHVEEENHELDENATKNGNMAMLGIGLGALGTILGGGSLFISRRKKND